MVTREADIEVKDRRLSRIASVEVLREDLLFQQTACEPRPLFCCDKGPQQSYLVRFHLQCMQYAIGISKGDGSRATQKGGSGEWYNNFGKIDLGVLQWNPA